MILNVNKFIAAEQPFWQELETRLRRYRERNSPVQLEDIRRLSYLYERTAGDLVRLRTFSGEPELQRYLESLTTSAYAEIYAARPRRIRFRPIRWLFRTWPRAFRAHFSAFLLALAIMLFGGVFGGVAVLVDPQSQEAIIPDQFSYLRRQTPGERVAGEEQKKTQTKLTIDNETAFAAALINNNIRVALLSLAFGALFGIGTVILLFYNGVLLGAIVADYVGAGYGMFAAGWLLPHGVLEIPAILISAQAGLVLAGCLLRPRGERSAALRRYGPDLIHLTGGVAVMLIWAGIVEAFLSQHHAPALSYSAKIAFGFAELVLLSVWLGCCGLSPQRPKEVVNGP